MGEIADMIINGDMCEACGEWMGDGQGFPQYCSEECAKDRGREDLINNKKNDINSIKEYLDFLIECLDSTSDELKKLKFHKKSKSLRGHIKNLLIFTNSIKDKNE